MLKDILADDDTHINHSTDGDGYTGKRNDISGNAEYLHGDEAHEHCHRKKPGNEDRAFHVHDHHENHDYCDEYLLAESGFQRTERFVYQARTVVKRNNSDLADCAVRQCLFGKAGRYLFDFLFYIVDS